MEKIDDLKNGSPMSNETQIGWKNTQLSEVSEIFDRFRKPINSKERSQRTAGKQPNELYPYFGATGQVGYIDDYLLDGEFILLGEDGAPFLDAYKEKAYMVNGKIWVNNHAHILKAHGSNRYLCYYLNQVRYNDFVTGTTRLKLNQSSMKQIPVKLPPLPEQHRIGAKIEELFSELDNGIAHLQKVKEQLKVYRQSVLKWAFNDNGNSNLVLLKEVSQKLQIGPFGTQLHKSDYIQNGIPLINPMHIQNGFIVPNKSYSISKEKRDSLPNYILKVGDVILGRRGEMGRCGIVKEKEKGWMCGTGSLFIRPIPTKIDTKYLWYFLRSQIAIKYLELNAGGTTMANLNKRIVSDIPIMLHSIKEQNKIVQEIESRLSIADKLEENIEQSLKQSEALKQSILKTAFEGKLVPQDPNDEPAEVLLERIKNSK